jgi:hypothetical protein
VRSETLELDLDPACAQSPYEIGREDPARFGHRLEAGRLDDRDTAQVAAVLRDLADTDSDPDLERRDRGSTPAVARDRPLDRHGRPDRAGRTVECGLDAVTRRSEHEAIVGGDLIAEQGVVVALQEIGPILAESVAERSGADHVGEQDPAHARHP